MQLLIIKRPIGWTLFGTFFFVSLGIFASCVPHFILWGWKGVHICVNKWTEDRNQFWVVLSTLLFVLKIYYKGMSFFPACQVSDLHVNLCPLATRGCWTPWNWSPGQSCKPPHMLETETSPYESSKCSQLQPIREELYQLTHFFNIPLPPLSNKDLCLPFPQS